MEAFVRADLRHKIANTTCTDGLVREADYRRVPWPAESYWSDAPAIRPGQLEFCAIPKVYAVIAIIEQRQIASTFTSHTNHCLPVQFKQQLVIVFCEVSILEIHGCWIQAQIGATNVVPGRSGTPPLRLLQPIHKLMMHMLVAVVACVAKKVLTARHALVAFTLKRERITDERRHQSFQQHVWTLKQTLRGDILQTWHETPGWQSNLCAGLRLSNWTLRTSCSSSLRLPNIFRQNGQRISFSSVDCCWWSAQTFMHLMWTLLPHPCLETNVCYIVFNEVTFNTETERISRKISNDSSTINTITKWIRFGQIALQQKTLSFDITAHTSDIQWTPINESTSVPSVFGFNKRRIYNWRRKN